MQHQRGVGFLGIVMALGALAVASLFAVISIFPMFQSAQSRTAALSSYEISADAALDFLVNAVRGRWCVKKSSYKPTVVADCSGSNYVNFDILVQGEVHEIGSAAAPESIELASLSSDSPLRGLFLKAPGAGEILALRYWIVRTDRYGNAYGAADQPPATEIYLKVNLEMEVKKQLMANDVFSSSATLLFAMRPLNSISLITPYKLILDSKSCTSPSATTYGTSGLAGGDLCLGASSTAAGMTFHSPVYAGGGIKVQSTNKSVAPFYFEEPLIVGHSATNSFPVSHFTGMNDPQEMGFRGMAQGMLEEAGEDPGMSKIFDLSTVRYNLAPNNSKHDINRIFYCQQRNIYSSVYSNVLYRHLVGSDNLPASSAYTHRPLAQPGSGDDDDCSGEESITANDSALSRVEEITFKGEMALSDRNYFNPQHKYDPLTGLVDSEVYFKPDPSINDASWSANKDWIHERPSLTTDGGKGAIMRLYLGDLMHYSASDQEWNSSNLDSYDIGTMGYLADDNYRKRLNKEGYKLTRLDLRKFHQYLTGTDFTTNMDKSSENFGTNQEPLFPYVMTASLGYGDTLKIVFPRDNRTIWGLLRDQEKAIKEKLNPDFTDANKIFPKYSTLDDYAGSDQTKTPLQKEEAVLTQARLFIGRVCQYFYQKSDASNNSQGLGLTFSSSNITGYDTSFVCNISKLNDAMGLNSSGKMTDEEKNGSSNTIPQISLNGLEDIKTLCKKHKKTWTVSGSEENLACGDSAPYNCFPVKYQGADFTPVPEAWAPTPRPQNGCNNNLDLPRCICLAVDSTRDLFYNPNAYPAKGVATTEKFAINNNMDCGMWGPQLNQDKGESFQDHCEHLVDSLKEYIQDINRYRRYMFRYLHTGYPELHISVKEINAGTGNLGPLTGLQNLKRDDLARLEFKIVNPLMFPRKVGFNFEIFDKGVEAVCGSSSCSDVSYFDTTGRLRAKPKAPAGQIYPDNSYWNDNQLAGPNRHFLWNKIFLVKNDYTGEIRLGPKLYDRDGCPNKNMKKRAANDFVAVPFNRLNKHHYINYGFLHQTIPASSKGEENAYYFYQGSKLSDELGNGEEPLFRDNYSYTCTGRTKIFVNNKCSLPSENPWYFLAGVNNGLGRMSWRTTFLDVNGAYQDNAQSQLQEFDMAEPPPPYSYESSSNGGTNLYKKYFEIAEYYLNLYKNRITDYNAIGSSYTSQKLLKASCDPDVEMKKLVSCGSTEDGKPIYVVAEDKKGCNSPKRIIYDYDPMNCHFIPCTYGSGMQYNPLDHYKACVDQEYGPSSELSQNKSYQEIADAGYDFSLNTRMSWHNAVNDIKADPNKLSGEASSQYSSFSSITDEGEKLRQQTNFLNGISTSPLNIACQEDFTMNQAANTFETAAIMRNCVVPSDKNIIAGFYVCDKLTISARTTPLKMIGTFIVGKADIAPSAYTSGIEWYSAFHDDALRILRANGYLTYLDAEGTSTNCPVHGHFSVPFWASVVAGNDRTLMNNTIACSGAQLDTINDNFTWPSIDPLVGYLDLYKYNSNTGEMALQCKDYSPSYNCTSRNPSASIPSIDTYYKERSSYHMMNVIELDRTRVRQKI